MILVADNVTVLHRDRSGARALADVSLDIAAGEMVAVTARRQTARRLLAMVCAGLLVPDHGQVTFNGTDATSPPAVRRGLSVFSTRFDLAHGATVVDQLTIAAQAHLRTRRETRHAIDAATDAHGLAGMLAAPVVDLDPMERFRAGLARALISDPSLVVACDPTSEISTLDRDTAEDRLTNVVDSRRAVLVVTDDVLPGARTLSLYSHDGQIAGDATPAAAPVINIRGGAA